MDVFPADDGHYSDDDYLQRIIDAYNRGEISEDEINELIAYANAHQPTMTSLVSLAKDCGLPTVTQMSESILPLLIICVAYRVLVVCLHYNDNGVRFNHGDSPSITNVLQDADITDNLLEFSNCILGFVAMEVIFGTEMLMLIFYAMAVFVVLTLAREHGNYVGLSVTVFSVFYIVLCEFYLLTASEWHKIRGAHMVMSMKAISLAFDVETGHVAGAPSVWAYSSYVFHVGTVVFGPWLSYRDYRNRLAAPLSLFDWDLTKRIVEKTLLLTVCLLMSTCVIPWAIDDSSYKWLVAYRDAQSFRFSHYFVSYTSQLTLLLVSYSILNSDVAVCRPITIEMPRSLVDVVSCWNVPMHTWLKTYVFKNARHLGTLPAILLTYAASSLLHGLNFQLSAVLLTLGFYTYIEYVFRNKLAYIFNACIQARACKNDCTHLYKYGNPWVILTNLAFTALCVFHLAYLGLMFDSSNTSEQGYTMWHTLAKWSNLGYLSHLVAMVTYAFYILI